MGDRFYKKRERNHTLCDDFLKVTTRENKEILLGNTVTINSTLYRKEKKLRRCNKCIGKKSTQTLEGLQSPYKSDYKNYSTIESPLCIKNTFPFFPPPVTYSIRPSFCPSPPFSSLFYL